jgi:hypothetical protein
VIRFKWAALAAIAIPLAISAHAGDKPKAAGSTQSVDSGTFGIFQDGKRVATETFTITQSSSGGVATGDFKTGDNVVNKSAQSYEMQIAADGNLVKYQWKELSPGQAQAVVVPTNDFLTERITKSPKDKPEEQPFLLPASTTILDDYFFSHRQILIWRFLATTCKQENGQVKCPVNQKTQFGALNPQQRVSIAITLEYLGRDKTTIKGKEAEYNKFAIRGETGDWFMWVDDNFRLQRIVVESEKTEVLRD